MFERRRRTNRFQVETLEGRVAPGIVATYATAFRYGEVLLIKGYTTLPTRQGDTLDIFATEGPLGNHPHNRSSKHQHTVVGEPFAATGHTGRFEILLESSNPNQRWYDDGRVTVYMTSITSGANKHHVESTISVIRAMLD
jgi:hypothetical protein